MTTFIILLRLTCLAVHKVANYDIFYKKLIHSLCAVAAIVLLVETTFTWLEYKRTLTTAQNDARKFYVTELGGYIGLEWQEYIDLARKNKDKIVTEEYWGIWSSLNRKFPAWPVDSVIHALGNVRGIAKTAIKDSDIITSTRHATSPTWQPWSLSQNFWFYDELILGWEPKMLSPTTVIWERNTTPRALIDITCDISEDKQKFILKPGAEGFYRVNVSYSTKEAGRYLLMLRNNISYGSDANGYVSVNPYNSNVTFPAQITNNSGNIFDSKIFGSNTSALSIQSCTAQKIAIDYPEILHIFKPDDFYLTDGNWIHGVARQWAGFFVPNKDEYSTQYKVGRYVKFENGEFRKINDIIPHGLYLNVYVNGEVLNQEVIGIPSKFSVVDNFQG